MTTQTALPPHPLWRYELEAELFEALRPPARLRALVLDLPNSVALSLFEKAGFRPGGSNARAFVEAKLPEILPILRRPEPLLDLLSAWYRSWHEKFLPDLGAGRADGPFPVFRAGVSAATSLRGWRLTLFARLAALDLCDEPPEHLIAQVIDAVAEAADEPPAGFTSTWDEWYLLAALGDDIGTTLSLLRFVPPNLRESALRVQAAMSDLEALAAAHEEEAGSEVDGKGDPQATVDAVRCWGAVHQAAVDALAEIHISLNIAWNNLLEIREATSRIGELESWSAKLASLEFPTGSGASQQVAVLENCVHFVSGLREVVEERLDELHGGSDDAHLRSVLDFVARLPDTLHRRSVDGLRDEAARIREALESGASAEDAVANSLLVAPLADILDRRRPEAERESAWSRLEDELPKRFINDLRGLVSQLGTPEAKGVAAATDIEGDPGDEPPPREAVAAANSNEAAAEATSSDSSRGRPGGPKSVRAPEISTDQVSPSTVPSAAEASARDGANDEVPGGSDPWGAAAGAPVADERPRLSSPSAGASEPVAAPSSSEAAPAPCADPVEIAAGAQARSVTQTSVVAGNVPRPSLPASADSYARYRECSWVAPSGRCEPAPWLDASFADKLLEASRSALGGQTFDRLWLFSQALGRLGRKPLVDPHDVESFAVLWTEPGSRSAGIDATRPGRLLDAARTQPAEPDLLLIGVFLEAIRPTVDQPWTHAEAQEIFDALQLESHDLRTVIDALLAIARRGHDPIASVRASFTRASMEQPREKLEGQLATRREEFRRVAVRLWNAAGGSIVHTHCKAAWDRFIGAHVYPLTGKLYPSRSGRTHDHFDWNLDDLSRTVRALREDHNRLADKGGAQRTDRVHMNRAAAEMADAALAVVDAAEHLRRQTSRQKDSGVHIPLTELQRLIKGECLAVETEEICRRLLQRVVDPRTAAGPVPDPLAIGVELFVRYPDLLPLVGSEFAAAARGERMPVRSLASPERAAAILLEDPTPAISSGGAATDLLRALGVSLRERERFDLLSYLLGTGVLESHEKSQIHREQSDELEALHQELEAVEALHIDIDELGLAAAAVLKPICDECRTLLGGDAAASRPEVPLLRSWLRGVGAYARAVRDGAVQRFREQALALDPTRQSAVLTALERGRFAAALEAMQPSLRPLTPPETSSERQTLWRRHAAEQYANGLPGLRPESEDLRDAEELVNLWRRRPCDASGQRYLRRSFWVFISGDEHGASSRRRRPRRASAIPTSLRAIGGSDIRVNTAELRQLFKRDGLNPSFLPQLRDFSDVVIASPPTSARPATLPRDLVRALAGYGEKDLVLFLVPGLSPATRSEVLAEFRGRKRVAGVLDDIDLCRLIAPPGEVQPDGLIGLLEIALEQLDLSLVSPFRSHDGQFIQEECFVGRRQDVDDLVSKALYSRVFSGRKLGKSALLKYVELTRDGSHLPSGNRLHVLDIIVGGGDSEQWLVSEIKSEMRRRLGFSPPENSTGDPGEELTQCLREFGASHPDESLLIILDEADAFVEGQLKEYDTKRERCLSFRMMKTIPGNQLDSNDLPRVRFVFSGYRVTNTREGAWANAGNVLKLGPLGEDDARQLIEGPLARLGIDVRDQAASIARRCGYQPAVLIRFGDRLLHRLRATRPAALRDAIVVTREDVVATFGDPTVQEEIRTVVTNNFQGNRVASIIFSSLLLAFKDLPPGEGLVDAPNEILQRIVSIDSDTGWLQKLDPTETGEIQRALADLVDRELLVQRVTDGQPRYWLRFPHHLAVLLQGDLANVVRQQVEALRGGVQEAFTLSNLLPQQTMDTLHERVRSVPSDDLPIAAAVVGSSWPEALQSRKGGVPDRLGFSPDEVYDLASPDLLDEVVACDTLIAINVRPTAAQAIVERRSKDHRTAVLLGGLDLLRWAVAADGAREAPILDYFGLRRLNSPRLSWWFERLRNHQFASPDAITRIMLATSGIPLLVGVIDEEIGQLAGGDVTRERLDAALAAFDARLPSVARSLLPDSGAGALTRRELELLRMIQAIGEISEIFHVHTELARVAWEKHYAELLPGALPLGAEPEDASALKVLQLSGLVPLSEGGDVVLAQSDALARIVRVLGETT